MKLKLSIGLALSSLVVQPAFSAISTTLSDPVPAVATLYDPNTTQTIVYTLKSDAPFAMPFTVSGISAPLTVSNDCGSTLPAAPQQCNISVTIAPTTDLAGKKINQTLIVNHRAQTQLEKTIAFSVSDSTKPSTLVAGGELSNAPGLLAVSKDNGANWIVKNANNGFPENTTVGFFDSVNCYDTGTCLAIGSSPELSKRLAVSLDGGNNWAFQINESIGRLYSATCTEDNQCFAVGYKINERNEVTASILYNDKVNSNIKWNDVRNLDGTTYGELSTISCTGSGNNTVCIAGGKQIDYSDHNPIHPHHGLLMSNSYYRKNEWRTIKTGDWDNYNPGYVDRVSCTGSGKSAICLAKVYEYRPDYESEWTGYYLHLTYTGGTFWSRVDKIDSAAGGISCTGSLSTAICVATNNKSLYVTRDGGRNWNSELVVGATKSALLDVNCTTNKAATFCATVGIDTSSNSPFVAINHGEKTWASKTIVAAPKNGYLTSVNCHYNGNSSVVCLAGGYNFSDSAPLLVVSSDGAGEAWKTVELPSIKGIDGEIYSVSGQGAIGSATAKKFGLKHGLKAVSL